MIRGSGRDLHGGGGGGKMPHDGPSEEASDSDKNRKGGVIGAAGSDPKPMKRRRPRSKARNEALPAPEPGTQLGTGPRLNAAVPAFTPAAIRLQASLPPPIRSYASVIGSAASVIERQAPLTAPRSTPATPSIIEADEALEVSQTATQDNAPENQPAREFQSEPVRSSIELVAPLTEQEAADVKDTSTHASCPVETRSAIGEAFLAAPPATSFLTLISQTQAILDAHARPVPELTNIDPGYAPVPTRASFEVIWVQNRVRSLAFPSNQTVLSTTAAASAPPPGPSAATSAPPPDPPTATSEPLPGLPDAASAPLPAPLILSTPPPLPFSDRAPVSSPTRGSRSRRDLSSNIVARRRMRMQSHSLSQPATNLFNGPRPLSRRLSFTPVKTPLSNSPSFPPNSPLDRPGDTPEQKEKIRSLMSSFTEIGGSFDTIEWGKNQGQANPGESPEILAVPSQPVAMYTTVGSLRPATTQQFTAPNRIQRDGTGRRPPQANLQGRAHDNQFGGRTMNQQYSRGYGSSTHPQYGGMNYSQYGLVSQLQSGSSIQRPYGSMNQPGSSMPQSYGSTSQPQGDSTFQSRFGFSAQAQDGAMSQPQYGVLNKAEHGAAPASQHDSTHQRQYGALTKYGQENQNTYRSSSRPGFGSIHSLQTRNVSSLIGLTDDEKNILGASGLSESIIGSSAPSMRSGNILHQDRNIMSRNDPLVSPQAEPFNVQHQVRGRGLGQTKPTQNLWPEIETAYNNTQQMNPAQQLARDTLSESSRANTHHVAMSSGTHLSQQSFLTGITSHGQVIKDDNTYGNTGYDSQGRGDLDQNYRFPPPGLVHPTDGNRSGTGYGQQMISDFGSSQQVTTNQRFQNQSGRPQPLTAGPPGQRQNVSAFPVSSAAQGVQVGTSSSSNMQQPPLLPTDSLWLPQARNNMFRTVIAEHSRIQDTLPPSEVRQFYPNGFANDITGQYTRLPQAVDEGRPGVSEQEIRAAKANKWFHSGLRNLDMTPNKYIAEMAERNDRLDNVSNSQAQQPLDEYGNPLTLRGLVETSEPLTIQQINEMNITEVSARLLGPVFGSTLRLADQRPGPNNLAMLARYAPGAPWTIDDSPQGNHSYFGEDWGPTPRRVGRDPRYRPFQ